MSPTYGEFLKIGNIVGVCGKYLQQSHIVQGPFDAPCHFTRIILHRPHGRRTEQYDALIVCKNNPAATVRSPYDVKIIVPKSYGDRTAIVRCP